MAIAVPSGDGRGGIMTETMEFLQPGTGSRAAAPGAGLTATLAPPSSLWTADVAAPLSA